MPTKTISLQCAKCDAVMPHGQEVPNHLLHGLLTLFTAGLWLFVWIPVAIGGGKGDAACTKCGNRRAPSGAATVSEAVVYKQMGRKGLLIMIAVIVAGSAALIAAGTFLDI